MLPTCFGSNSNGSPTVSETQSEQIGMIAGSYFSAISIAIALSSSKTVPLAHACDETPGEKIGRFAT